MLALLDNLWPSVYSNMQLLSNWLWPVQQQAGSVAVQGDGWQCAGVSSGLGHLACSCVDKSACSQSMCHTGGLTLYIS